MVKFRYTPEMIAWLQAHSKGVEYTKLAVRFNKKFGLNKTARQIQSACHDHNAHNGIYKIDLAKREIHKSRWRPVGSTRLDKDGYIKVKVAEPCHWELAHIHEWVKHNGDFDRRKEIIMFVDGDRTHWQIKNLRKVSRRLIGCINECGLMPDVRTPEIFDAVILFTQNKVAMSDAFYKASGSTNRNAARQNLQYHLHKDEPEFREKRKQYYKKKRDK